MKIINNLLCSVSALLQPLLKVIPWSINKIYTLGTYILAGYVIAATFVGLVTDFHLTVTALNIIFGLGLIVMGFLAIPAVMSTDSAENYRLGIFGFILPVVSYPVVYLAAVVSSIYMGDSENYRQGAIYVAMLPGINFSVLAFTIVVKIVQERRS